MTPQDIKAALLTLTTEVYHYFARANNRMAYVVWQEDNTQNFYADNRTSEHGWQMSVDLFTKTENDPLMDSIPAKFDDLGVPYRVESVDYEDDTEYIHVTWAVVLYG